MGLYLNERWRLKSFSAASKLGKSTVKIEIETDDYNELGFFMSTLDDMRKQQESQKSRRSKPRVLALPAPGGQP